MTVAALNFRADGIHRPRPVSLSVAARSGKRQTETPGYNDEGINAQSRARYAICRRQVLYPLSYAAGYAGLSNLSWADGGAATDDVTRSALVSATYVTVV